MRGAGSNCGQTKLTAQETQERSPESSDRGLPMTETECVLVNVFC